MLQPVETWMIVPSSSQKADIALQRQDETQWQPQDSDATPRTPEDVKASEKRVPQRKAYQDRSMNRQEFIRQLSNCCPHSTQFLNGEANRSQLVQFFRDNYIPEPHCADFPPLIWIVDAASAGMSTALNGAVNAVSICSIYRNTNDTRLLHAATKLYYNAVKEARKELNAATNPATSVAISYTFSFCELLRCEALDDSGTEAHTLYAMAILMSSRRRPR